MGRGYWYINRPHRDRGDPPGRGHHSHGRRRPRPGGVDHLGGERIAPRRRHDDRRALTAYRPGGWVFVTSLERASASVSWTSIRHSMPSRTSTRQATGESLIPVSAWCWSRPARTHVLGPSSTHCEIV